MVRIATRLRDKSIREQLRAGKAPKEIAVILNLSSVWVVYDTVRRIKSKNTQRA